MLRWHLLKIKEIHVCKRKVNECSSQVTFWFHRLLSLSIKSDVLLDVGDLHSILQPSPSRLVSPPQTEYISGSHRLYVIWCHRLQQAWPSSCFTNNATNVLRNIHDPHIPLERLEQPSPAKLWTVQFSCSLYLYIIFVWLLRGRGRKGCFDVYFSINSVWIELL